MKRTLRVLFLTLFFLTTYCVAQYNAFQSNTLSTVTPAPPINTKTTVLFQKLAWVVTGSPSGCTISVDSSPDNVTYSVGGIITPQTCTSNGATSIIGGSAVWTRVNVSALSAGTVTYYYTGWSYNPQGGSGGSVNPGTANQMAIYSGTSAISADPNVTDDGTSGNNLSLSSTGVSLSDVSSNLFEMIASVTAWGFGCSGPGTCTGGAITLGPNTPTTYGVVTVADQSGNSLVLGGNTAQKGVKYSLSNNGYNSAVGNLSGGNTTLVTGNPVVIGVNSVPGSFTQANTTPSFTVDSTNGPQILGTGATLFKWLGATSGSFSIGVNAVAGTPACWLAPTTSPTSGQTLSFGTPGGSPSCSQLSYTSGGGGGGDTITSPNGTLTVGGTSSNTTLDFALGHANTWTATQTFPNTSITNAELVNQSTTVNGVTCTLGSTCSITATPATLVGTSYDQTNLSSTQGAFTLCTVGTNCSTGNTYRVLAYIDASAACTTGTYTAKLIYAWTDATVARGFTVGPLTIPATQAPNAIVMADFPIYIGGGTVVTVTPTVTGSCTTGSGTYDVHTSMRTP